VGKGDALSGDQVNPNSSWERLSLLQRELEVAISEQDFKAAASLRDETKVRVH